MAHESNCSAIDLRSLIGRSELSRGGCCCFSTTHRVGERLAGCGAMISYRASETEACFARRRDGGMSCCEQGLSVCVLSVSQVIIVVVVARLVNHSHYVTHVLVYVCTCVKYTNNHTRYGGGRQEGRQVRARTRTQSADSHMHVHVQLTAAHITCVQPWPRTP